MRNLSDARRAYNLAGWHRPLAHSAVRSRSRQGNRKNAYAIWPSGANSRFVRYWQLEIGQRVNAMRMRVLSGVLGVAVLAGCVATPNIDGSSGAPSFSALQEMCGTTQVDYGGDAPSVYTAFFDAYVAQRRGGLSKDRYCAFQGTIAARYGVYRANPGPEAQSAWASFFLDQRAQALSWRAAVDPTLRAG